MKLSKWFKKLTRDMDDCEHLSALGDDPDAWAAPLTVPHTRQGIHSLKVARPFAGMAALIEEFSKSLAGVRSVGITHEEGRTLVRQVIGWPQLPEDPQPWQRDEQAKLDTDLETRLSGYFHELGKNAYAAFKTMTDIASRPPQSPRFRRDRTTLERRAGAWLRDFRIAASQPGFSVTSHLDNLSKTAAPGSFIHR